VSDFDKDAAFEKFKETWEPSDELADKAKAEEKRLKQTETVLKSVAADLTKKIAELHEANVHLRDTVGALRDSNADIKQKMGNLENQIDSVVGWWDDKTNEIRQMMAMMAAMGFEIDLT